MPQPIDREGNFRANIVGPVELTQAQSGAVAARMRFRVFEALHNGQWQDWTPYEVEVDGEIWILKKDGTANENAVRNLVEALGWDGSVESLVGTDWSEVPVQITVKRDSYNGHERFRVAWINHADSQPFGSAVDETKVRELQARFGAQLRAIAGRKSVAAPAPAGRPANVPARPAAPSPGRPAAPRPAAQRPALPQRPAPPAPAAPAVPSEAPPPDSVGDASCPF